MSVAQTLNQLAAATTPVQAGTKNFSIKWLRQGLYEMGFDKTLAWDTNAPEGAYDDATANALKKFAAKNQIQSDGKTLSPELLRKLTERYDLLQSLEQVHRAILLEETEQLYDPADATHGGTLAVDRLLRELGFLQPHTNDALTEFAKLENIAFDGKTFNIELAKGLRACLLYFYGDDFLNLTWFERLTTGTLTTAKGSDVIVASGDKKVLFKKAKAGYYTVGNQTIKAFLESNRNAVRGLNVSDAAINTMIAVSENEGNLDAINTYDNAFISFGAFQWTLGTGSASGELAALLQKIKKFQPAAFQEYFGQYGIDVDHASTNATYGFLSFRGNKVVDPADKDLFRPPHRAFRFWLAGHDDRVKAVQIEHALSRLNTFYWKPQLAINGLLLAQIITSQYGVALLLDNHVNRPAYVKPCIERAITAIGLDKPVQTWTTEDELKIIEAYLKIREVYGATPMTHARKRADVTKKYLTQGVISADRNSFKFSATGERSLHSFPTPPADYDTNDYPIMTKGNKMITYA